MSQVITYDGVCNSSSSISYLQLNIAFEKHLTRNSANRRESAHLTSLYRTVQKAFQYVELFKRGSRVWHSDGRTDGQTVTISNSALSHSYMRAKMNIDFMADARYERI